MRNYRLLLDCDGVMGDFINSLQKIHPELEVPTQWDFISGLPSPLKEEVLATLNGEDFWANMDPLMTIETFEALRDSHTSLLVVTSPWTPLGRKWNQIRRGWLWEHFRVLPDDVVIDSEKFKYRGVLIDDKPANVQAHLDSGQLAYLLEQPWNRGSGLPRVKMSTYVSP